MTSTTPADNGPLGLVVFGFGPIGAGLFALEACRSRNFQRVVVAEALPHVVEGVRRAEGRFGLNIAHADRVDPLTVGPVSMEDPAVEADRQRLLEAIAGASEIATAVPSVRFYRSDGPGSIHRLLAAGLARRRGRPAVVYTAENDNRAAEILEEAVLAEVPGREREDVRRSTRFLNTVIGKMSLVIADPKEVRAGGLRTVAPGDPRAFLVESFNRILISRAGFPPAAGFRRGLEVFEEKKDLLPFEEAKLYGHNAVHALAAYLASLRRLTRLEELRKVPGAVDFVRAALVGEAGAALVRRWSGADPLFTPEGLRRHADDLLERMFNPFLGDLVERVARDPERKLAWNDRLVGAVRLVQREGLRPRRLAVGAAAALACHASGVLDGRDDPESVLAPLWRADAPEPREARAVLEAVAEGLAELKRWLAGGADIFSENKE